MSDIMKNGVFDWDVFKMQNIPIAVHLKTQEECDEFSKMLDEHGMKWSTNDSYLKENYWGSYKIYTCYTNNGMLGDLDYYKKKNYHILEFSDYFKKETKETKQEGEPNMNNITVNMENLTTEEREQLLKLIEKANEKKSEPKVWKPKNGEEYYFIGNFNVRIQTCTNHDADIFHYEIGNCFRTEEEAKFAIEKLKVIAEMKRFALEHNDGEIDWNNYKQSKYYIFIDMSSKNKEIFIIKGYICKKYNDIYFTSKEIAEKAIEIIGKDRLKKYYFEVED